MRQRDTFVDFSALSGAGHAGKGQSWQYDQCHPQRRGYNFRKLLKGVLSLVALITIMLRA